MKAFPLILVSSLALGFLSACDDKAADKEVHTIDWYLAHLDVLKVDNRACLRNPGEMMTPNCMNAHAAVKEIDKGNFENLEYFLPEKEVEFLERLSDESRAEILDGLTPEGRLELEALLKR